MIMKTKEHVEADGVTKIHNVRFYNLAPRSIQCLAYNKIFNKLAMSRQDGSIEIWNFSHKPCLEKIIAETPGKSVEGLVWAGERLFSAGLTGELVEWDLQTLLPRFCQHVTGNAIWCLDVNAEGTELAIGTEEGFINIFDIADEQMVYKQLFDKQEGRVLCCKFDASGKYLVTGSMGLIRIWEVRTGHALQKMTVARKERKQEVIVWTLQVLKDFSIIAGDSTGQISVWDGRLATMVESHKVLQTDVLAVAVNEEENLLFCSGIEPIIRIYAKTVIKREDMVFTRWVKYLQRNVHDHDVKALTAAGELIISGGMDGYLGVSSMSKMRPSIAKYGPFLQHPIATVAPAQNLILLRYNNYLEIWRLGSTKGNALPQLQSCKDDNLNVNNSKKKLAPSKLLSLDAPPEKLLEFKSKEKDSIISATISPDGQWLCYSTLREIRLFRFQPAIAGKTSTQLQRIKDLPEQFSPASHIKFSADSKRLFLVNVFTQQIFIFSVLTQDGNDLDFLECIESPKHLKASIKLFELSQCSMYAVAAGTDNTIAVWSVANGKHFKHHLNLPRYSAATTAIALHARLPRLVASFADGKVFEYDLEEMCFTCSEQTNFVSSAETHCISNILLDARNPNIFIMHNNENMFVVEKHTASAADEKIMQKKPKKHIINDKKLPGLRLKMQKADQHYLHLEWLSSNELITVGINPISLIDQLPDAFKQKKFGAA